MEYWNNGMLGLRAEIKHFNFKKLLSFNFVQDKLTHYFNCKRSELIYDMDLNKFWFIKW